MVTMKQFLKCTPGSLVRVQILKPQCQGPKLTIKKRLYFLRLNYHSNLLQILDIFVVDCHQFVGFHPHLVAHNQLFRSLVLKVKQDA